MVFKTIKGVQQAIAFYNANPKYCDIHNTKMIFKFSKSKDGYFFLHLYCAVDGCNNIDETFKEYCDIYNQCICELPCPLTRK